MVGRCPTRRDAQGAADWLVDRFSRLVPGLPVTADIEPGGGQFLVILATGRLTGEIASTAHTRVALRLPRMSSA